MALPTRLLGDAAAVHRASWHGGAGAHDLCQRRSETAAPARPPPYDRSSAPRGELATDRVPASTCNGTPLNTALDPATSNAVEPPGQSHMTLCELRQQSVEEAVVPSGALELALH